MDYTKESQYVEAASCVVRRSPVPFRSLIIETHRSLTIRTGPEHRLVASPMIGHSAYILQQTGSMERDSTFFVWTNNFWNLIVKVVSVTYTTIDVLLQVY